jgi:hypothetical protein
MDKKYNRVRITSPKGVAVYPKLNRADTKFNEDGVYSTKLLVSKDEAKAFVTQVKQVLKDYYEETCKTQKKAKLKLADSPWKETEDGENLEINFKLPAKVKTKSGEAIELRPALFDCKGHPTSELIGGGSVIKIGCEASPWFVPALGVGITLRLRAVQVLELKSPSSGGNSFEAFGFSSEEEGYVAGGETFPELTKPKESKDEASQTPVLPEDF